MNDAVISQRLDRLCANIHGHLEATDIVLHTVGATDSTFFIGYCKLWSVYACAIDVRQCLVGADTDFIKQSANFSPIALVNIDIYPFILQKKKV